MDETESTCQEEIADLKRAHAEVGNLQQEADMNKRREKSMRQSGKELMRGLDEVEEDAADERKRQLGVG